MGLFSLEFADVHNQNNIWWKKMDISCDGFGENGQHAL